MKVPEELPSANAPVTPAMVNGWAPNTEKMNAAMNDDIKTSDTPYSRVVSMRSKENAIPGSTLENTRYFRGFSHTKNHWTNLAKKIRAVAGTTR